MKDKNTHAINSMKRKGYGMSFDREQYYQDSIREYSQYLAEDPLYVTDEEFYGKWDNSIGDWEVISKLYYEKFPVLSEIEEAAKKGNYTECKDKLLAYYREKCDKYFINNEPRTAELSKLNRDTFEAMFDNFIRIGADIYAGKIWFRKDFSWNELEVTHSLITIAHSAGTEKYRKFLLACGKKDGYRVEIDKTEEYMPYITAVINGENRIYFPNVITYVTGLEPDKGHADEKVLLVEESVSSIGSSATVDENTKNILLQFDFRDLQDTDLISSAILHLYGRFTEDDISEAPRIANVTFKSVYVINWMSANIIDNSITWNEYRKLTIMYRNYDGEPTFRAVLHETERRERNITVIENVLHDLARGYHWTKEETFAFHAIRHLIQHIIDKGNYEAMMHDYNRVVHTALELANYAFGAIWHLDMLMDSKYMTPDAFTIIQKHNWMMGKWLMENWPIAFEEVNHGCYAVNGLESICLRYPEFRDVYGPIEMDDSGKPILMNTYGGSVRGGWMAVANYRRVYKTISDIMDDGCSVEGSIEYAMEGMENYLSALNYGDRLGIDCSYLYTNTEANKRIESGLMYVISKLNPMLCDTQVGDGEGWKYSYSSRFKQFQRIIDNPYLDYVVSERKKGLEPPFLTIAYDSLATATFRNAWVDDQSISADFESRGGGSHVHNADGNIVLFAYGNYLLVDPRQGNYDCEQPYERWVSSTRGHNTVEINNTVTYGHRYYATQMEPLVFEKDEYGNPKVDENGVAMVDDPMNVPIKHIDVKKGSLFPNDREINTVYDYIKASSNGYKGNKAMTENFNFERDVLFVRAGYFVVVDYMSPELGVLSGSNHYKQMWHFLPNANMTVDGDKNTMRTNFNDDANLIIATVKNNENMTVQYKYGLYAAERYNFNTVKYGTFEQDKVETATFNTLLYPLKRNQIADISTSKISLDLGDDEANSFRAVVIDKESGEKKDIQFYTLFDYTKKASIEFGSYETNGTLALGDMEEGRYANVVLRNGSYLKNKTIGEYVIYSEKVICDIGVHWKDDIINIAYGSEDLQNKFVDLKKLIIRANGVTKTVRVNGEKVEFKQNEKYVFFESEPKGFLSC